MIFNQKGYSIIEVLIVTAIVALVFAIFFRALTTRSHAESLKHAVETVTVDINDVLNDLRTGSFYDIEGITCQEERDSGGNRLGTIEYGEDPDARPGDNDDCIFLGKSIHLGTSPAVVGDDTPSLWAYNYIVHTVIGLESQRGTERFQFGDSGASRNLFVFKNDDPNQPNFDSTVKHNIPNADITSSFVWDDTDNDGVVTDNEIVAYIDGFAVVLSSFGVISDDNRESVLGGARSIGLQAMYKNDSDKKLKTRVRPSLSEFVQNIETDNTNDYFHDVGSGNKIIVCLEGAAGKAVIRVGSDKGILNAVADLDAGRADQLCS